MADLTKEQKARFEEFISKRIGIGTISLSVELAEQFLASELARHDKELIMAIDEEIESACYHLYILGLTKSRKIISEWK